MAHPIIATAREAALDAQIRKAEQEDEWDQESITKSYHRLRVEELPKYFDSFPDDKQRSVKNKLKVDAIRVQKSRDRLATSERNKNLFDGLQKSFVDWRLQAEQRVGVSFKHSIVDRHRYVKTIKTIGAEDTTLPDDADGESENPEHDFKAGFLFFEQYGIGWKKTNVEEHIFDRSAEFPDQKATVHDALFSEEYNPFAETNDKQGRRHLKYVHLPANHMGWVEVSLD